jgi:hypothetical protein
MNLSRNGERLLLTYERSGFELLTGPVFMVALVVLVLLAAAIVVTSVIYGKGLEITLLMLFGVGIGCAGIYEELSTPIARPNSTSPRGRSLSR